MNYLCDLFAVYIACVAYSLYTLFCVALSLFTRGEWNGMERVGLICGLVAPHHVEQKEKSDLLEELMLLPENAVVRRINELVKRARSVKVHAYIIHYLRKQMPYMMGKQEKQVRFRPSAAAAAVGVRFFYRASIIELSWNLFRTVCIPR